MMKNKEHPFISEYLNPLIELHKLVFEKISEQTEYDPYSMIDVYMQQSDMREKMDIGNWSALNKGHKQVLNSIPKDACDPWQGDSLDVVKAHWIAIIYTLFQWEYNISSREINKRIPAKELGYLYNPFHEASDTAVCRKLLHKFFAEKEEND